MLIIPPAHQHCVYMLTRRDHIIIYVGSSSNLFARLGAHAVKSWWREVVGIQVESFETRAAADTRESELIALINPFYNVSGSGTGEARHLEEMRLAVGALRNDRLRKFQVANLQASILEIEKVTCADDGSGVTLAEAVSSLQGIGGRHLTLHGLRDASKRPGFPGSVGTRGRGKTAAKLYDLAELKTWRERQMARIACANR